MLRSGGDEGPAIGPLSCSRVKGGCRCAGVAGYHGRVTADCLPFRPSRPAAAAAACLAALLLLAGCASIDVSPVEKLDERSGDTLIMTRQPLDFVRVRDIVDGTRDYVRLVAVEEDHVGQYNTWLLAYRWTTIDKAPSPVPDERLGALQIRGDDREWSLQPLAAVPDSLRMRRDLYAPAPVPYAAWAYRVTLADLRAIAGSRALLVSLPQEAIADPLSLLEDGRPALLEFARREGTH